jgi:hypothetical protein
MRRWLAAPVLALGCGAPSPPHSVIGNQVTRSELGCDDAATIVYRQLYASDDHQLGELRRRAISQACGRDLWSARVLTCIGDSGDDIKPCIDRLTTDQRERFDLDMVSAMNAIDGAGGDGYGGASYGGGSYGGAGYADLLGPMGPECVSLAVNALAFPPATSLDGDERDAALRIRTNVIEHTCEAGAWKMTLGMCLEMAAGSEAITSCLGGDISSADSKDLSDRLAAADALAVKVVVARQKPATINCDHAVASYYGEARWNDHIDVIAPSERKDAIAQSRANMLSACAVDGWDATKRGCLALGGAASCLAEDELVWGFPAAGVLGTSGLAACDLYGEVVQRVQGCTAVSSARSGDLKQKYDQVAVNWSWPLTRAARVATARMCRDGVDRVVAEAFACKWQ